MIPCEGQVIARFLGILVRIRGTKLGRISWHAADLKLHCTLPQNRIGVFAKSATKHLSELALVDATTRTKDARSQKALRELLHPWRLRRSRPCDAKQSRDTLYEEMQLAIDDATKVNPSKFPHPDADTAKNAGFHLEVYERMTKNPIFNLDPIEKRNLIRLANEHVASFEE